MPSRKLQVSRKSKHVNKHVSKTIKYLESNIRGNYSIDNKTEKECGRR